MLAKFARHTKKESMIRQANEEAQALSMFNKRDIVVALALEKSAYPEIVLRVS